MTCVCYVSELPAPSRVAAHYGEHNPSCPVYRPSLDPVDRKRDARLRELREPTIQAIRPGGR